MAPELKPVEQDLRHVLGLAEPFRDPGVAVFGLENAVFALGTDFLEAVAPVQPDTTAGRFLQRQGGAAGYMALLQSDDLAADRARAERAGVRVVWEIDLPGACAVHLHPRDVGAAIVSFDQMTPPDEWAWGGEGWRERGAEAETTAIEELEIRAADPQARAARWAEVLGLTLDRDSDGNPILRVGEQLLRFVPAGGKPEEICGVRLRVRDRVRVRRRAFERGLPVTDDGVRIGGVWFRT